MPKLLGDNGVLHAKFWIVDSRHVYIGSANMDWKSLTEVIAQYLLLLKSFFFDFSALLEKFFFRTEN